MPIQLDTKHGILALTMIPGLGNIVCKNLLDTFGYPERIFCATISELSSVEGVRKETANNIAEKRCSGNPDEELQKARDKGVRVITYIDPSYPGTLREIHDPPMVLYVKGKDIPLNTTFLAIVGSRNATHYGLKAAESLGQGLARRGLGIASGMAKGIDAASHWGCINGKGFPIAVLGTGIDVIYPPENEKLYNHILDKGAVISEFPMGTSPSPAHFPVRNRIISGLSKGVIVVEATKKSGSLITASLALEQGREVFAVPGSIESFKSTGCHFLIKQGARLIENSDDVLEELGLNFPGIPKPDKFSEIGTPEMSADERALYDIIGNYPMHIDRIAKQGNLSPGEAASLLTRMELKGIIRQLPGKMFVR